MKQTIKKGDSLKCTTLCKGLRIGTVYTALEDEKGGKVWVLGEHKKKFDWYATYFRVVTPETGVPEKTTSFSPIKTETSMETTINMVEAGLKAGSMVQCIIAAQDLTKFNTYLVIDHQNGPFVNVVNDKGLKGTYNASLFKPTESQIKAGDIIVSINTNNTITSGNEYEALESETDGRVLIKNDVGKERWYLVKHFKKGPLEEENKGRVRVLTMSNNKIEHDSFTSHLEHENQPITMGGTESFPSFKGNEQLEASEPHVPKIMPIEEKPTLGELMNRPLDKNPAAAVIQEIINPSPFLVEAKKALEGRSTASPHITASQPQEGARTYPEGYEPFDYQEALKRPQDVFTIDLEPVEISGYNPKAIRFHTVAGWVAGEISSWNIYGMYNEDGKQTDNDLMMRIKMDVFYRNEYRLEELKALGELAFTQYETLEEALDDEDLGPKAVMKITYHKDEFISSVVVHKYPKK